MTVSVLIPAYNCERTVGATLASVFSQSVAPNEIVVIDDGSTDNTAAVVTSYGSRVTLLRQPNGGLAKARNVAIAASSGDLVALLDADDVLHPRYVETQRRLYAEYPNAAALFTGHITCAENENVDWTVEVAQGPWKTEVIEPLFFLERYASAPGPFTMSSVCVPRPVLGRLGSEPFKLKVAEDLYFCNRLALLGPVIYYAEPLAAYRMREGSLSSNRIRLNSGEVQAFELLREVYRTCQSAAMRRAFRRAFAVKRRLYAKTLMGADQIHDARRQLVMSLSASGNLGSLAKSLGLLSLTFMPSVVQPRWPPSNRQYQK